MSSHLPKILLVNPISWSSTAKEITTLDAVEVAEMEPSEARELFRRYAKLTALWLYWLLPANLPFYGQTESGFLDTSKQITIQISQKINHSLHTPHVHQNGLGQASIAKSSNENLSRYIIEPSRRTDLNRNGEACSRSFLYCDLCWPQSAFWHAGLQ